MKKTVNLLLVLLLTACSNNRATLIKSEEDFTFVEAGSHSSWQSIAQDYMGNAQWASIIERYNSGIDLKSGSIIAIPKKNFYPSAVFSDGYQLITILCYHQFTQNNTDTSKMVVSAAEFNQQMQYLADNNYQVINLQQLYDFLQGQHELPDKSVLITVDDGYRSYLDVAYPILKKYKFSSTLFVYPEFVGAGLALDWDEINKLTQDPLVSIESHSKTHDSLQPDPKGESANHYQKRLYSEVVETDDIFEKRIGRRSSFFAYPYGNTSPQLIELLQANHYQLAFTVKKGGNPNFASPYLLNRTMIYGGDSIDRFSRNLKHYEHQDLK